MQAKPALGRVAPAAIASFLVPFAIYAASVAPDVAYWDTGELQRVPYTFDVAHPTGFPLFVFVGWFVSHVIPFGTAAWRIGLMSAAAMATAAYFVYATVVELEEKPAVGAFAAILFAVGEVAWTRGSRAEPHALALAFASLTVWSLLRWRRTGRSDALYGAALAYGLALATHGLPVLMAPGLALLLFPRALETPRRTVAAATALLLLPSLLYLYIPLRSAYLAAQHVDPLRALGIGPGDPTWDNSYPTSFAAFVRYMGGGENSPVGPGLRAMFDLNQYPSVVGQFFNQALHEYGTIGLFLAALGLVLLAWKDRFVALGLFVACMACVPFGLVYIESDPARYLLTAYWFLAILIAIGVGRVTAELFPRREKLAAVLATSVMLGLATSTFVANRAIFGQRQHRYPREFVDRVVEHTPDDAILVATWVYATPLRYVDQVDHGLGHRVVVTAHAAQYKARYRSWLKSRPLYLVNQDYPGADFRTVVLWPGDPKLVEIEPK